MKRLVWLQVSLITTVVLTIIFATYLLVYRPLNDQLKDQTYENYLIISIQKERQVEQFIERSIEGSNSLSSRSFIRNAIQDYHDGIISFTELSNLTQPIYEDGFNALVNVSSATRVVDGIMVAEVNESLDTNILGSVEDVVTTQYDIIINDNGFIYVRVISPIVNNDHVIGHDSVTFDMSPLFEELNEGDKQLKIMDNESRSALINNAQIITNHQDYTLLVKNEEVIYVSEGLLFCNDTYLFVILSQNILEHDIDTLTMQNILRIGFLLLVGLTSIIGINVIFSTYRLKLSKIKRKYFQEKANVDTLTGVYTRHYLAHRLDRLKKEGNSDLMPVAVVMSDVNNFKKYNDTYGHQSGDQALIDLADIFKTLTRDNDLIVRYGGDEFLFLFPKTTETLCENIMIRINDKIKTMYKDKNISLAYGYVMLYDPNEVENAIREADRLMYENKRNLN